MVNYHKTVFQKPDLTRVLGIPTYYALHHMQLEIKSNAIYVYSKLGCGNQGNLKRLITNTKYATLSPVPYIRIVHSGIIQILNNSTHVASYKLKRV